MATVFLNGRFVSMDEARVSAFDAGFQHGVGLFETMSARLDEEGKAQIFRLEQHLERLIASAKMLGLTDRLRVHALAEAVAGTVERSQLARARVRLTITGGDLNLLTRRTMDAAHEEGQEQRRGIEPTVLIVSQPATLYPAEMFERGVGVVIGEMRLNPLDPMAGHKTLNYWGRLRVLQEAAARQAGEALLLLVTNHLAGGCVSNVFLFKQGRLLTPIARGEEGATSEGGGGGAGAALPRLTTGGVLPSPVLPGVMRGWVMDWAREQQVPVERRMLSIDDLLGADEVFLTNSSWGVLPVVRVEREDIGDGEVGGLTADVRRAWLLEAGGGD
jgi:branched-chain amino acid aminotransferase